MNTASGRALGEEYLAKMKEYLARTECLPISPDGTLNITAIAAAAGVPKQSLYKNPGIREAVEQAKAEHGVAIWAEREGTNTLQRFNAWVTEREAAADWKDYIRQGKLNRTEIASECGFGLSALQQNPAVKAALEALEARLLASGILKPVIAASDPTIEGASDATSQSIDKRVMAAKAKAEQRVKQLEEQNAALRAEIRDLRDQLTQYRHLDEHLCASGRLLHA